LQIFFGIFIYSLAYLFANYRQFLNEVYYRYAAGHDAYNAIRNLSGFLFQWLLLLVLILFLSKRLVIFLLVIISISIFVHLSYEKILGGIVNLDVMTWMLSETRQASSALGEFLVSFSQSTFKVVVIILFFIYSRYLLRPLIAEYLSKEKIRFIATISLLIIIIFVPGEIFRRVDLPQGNETSIYTLVSHVLLASNPHRMLIDGNQIVRKPLTKKIVWFVDESSSAAGVDVALKGILQRHNHVNFGETASMGNCSGPSNAALRWGVNVLQVNARSDLRTTPTIWAYAKQAGYATTLIDGQVSGAPQNMVWEPERALIDNFLPAKGDIDTDFKIAKLVNELLKRPGSDFIYVVLRGAHYAYESNYPKDFVPAGSTLFDRYVGAIKYSKKDFFDVLFLDVDRSQVAAIYTSDHGQHLEEGKVPHCTLKPSSDEYSVPLLAFLPLSVLEQLRLQTDFSSVSGRSHSQIFPTSLWLMGYDQNFAEENFDVLLNRPTNRYVWFGRSFVPHADTGLIEVHTSDKFPMR